jgi:uncharacterized protein
VKALLRAWLVFAVVMPVRFYQVVIGPLMPQVCRYYPSCSQYFILAIYKHGPIRGTCKGVWRVCRCNPFSRGGYDLP